VLVAYEYRHELARILKAFPGARQLKRRKDEDDWNEGRIDMLVAHPDSAGHGLNLQHGGNILVYFGHTWKLEGHLQSLERIGPVRQMQSGYDRPVFVYSIIADNTQDEAVLARNSGKASMMDALMDSLKATV
jgi:SNF2 family DNA or RNA helicase